MKYGMELSKLPYYGSEAKWDKVDKQFKNRLNFFTPNLRLFKQRTENLETRRTITYLGLKAIIYQKKSGHLPNSLNDIISNIPVPNTLNKIIINFPIDPYSGKQYVYKKLADGFIIYGVGRDGKDDNGNPETDIVWNNKI
jgi:hypothetical protein